ncbi:MAG: glycosyl hydrolase 53 family protein, partial [Eubacterium sp.]|nr:glycosyl hydrolase 53 family protein [Eubacterium sp.]
TDYNTLVGGSSNEYCIYNGKIYTSLNAALEAISPSSLIKDAEISVDKVDNLSDDFMLGTDISAVHSIFKSGAKYYDYNGEELDEAGFFKFLSNNGVNWVRIRVWNDPYDADRKSYGGGNNSLATAVEMGKLATEAGLKVFIDFHYSDFWADPGKQMVPKAWKDKTVDEKATAVYEFTKDALETLKSEGVDVGMVQIGNETSGGKICGIDANKWDDSSKIFKSGSKAVRDIDENILIALHFTNPEKGYSSTAKALSDNAIDYDVFASSYYPYWHGSLTNLKSELDNIAKTYDKKVMVAETSYAWTLEDGDGFDNTVRIGQNDTGEDLIYPFTVNGQAKWVRDVVDTVNSTTNGIGVFYWEAAWIPVENINNAATDDEKANIIASNKVKWEQYGSGWATSFAGSYDPDDAGKWYGGSAIDNQAFFDFDGKALNSLKVYEYLKTGSIAEKVSVDSVKDSEVSVIYNAESIKEDVLAAMPQKVNVILSDASKTEVEVNWNTDDLDKANVVGEYEIKGTVIYNEVEYSAKCKLSILPINLLKNPGFESGISDPWTIEGEAGVTGDDPHSGTKSLHFYNAEAKDFTVEQTIEGLEPGVYAFTGYFQGDQKNVSGSNIFATVTGDKYSQSFDFNGWTVWQTPVIDNIVVTDIDEELTVGFYITYGAGGWGTCDDMYLYKVSDIESVSADDLSELKAGRLTNLIASINSTITINDEEYIAKVRTIYNSLSDSAKSMVADDYVEKLADAEYSIAALEVQEMVDSLGVVNADTLENIRAAQKAYEELPDKAKEKFSASTKEDLDSLVQDADVFEVEELIKAIDSEEDGNRQERINAAKEAYDKLSDAAKKKISANSIDKLNAATKETSILADAENAIKLINEIGNASLENEEKIIKAREAYEALSDEAKAKVPSEILEILTKAERDLEQAKKDASEAKIVSVIPVVTIKNDKIIYTGKNIKPVVTVKVDDKKLMPSNYTVTYPKASKNVGTYTIIVTLKANSGYKGTKSIPFRIIPKKTGISKLVKGKKSFTIKAKTVKQQATGYQIQYSTNKNFSVKKTVTIKNNKITSKAVKGLKSKTKYYVRVRTFKTVKGKKYYSDWSKVKTVKTK